MIPLFRQKIKEQELTIDVLKHALCKADRAPMTMKQVDEFIIRQTLGGPKRFRPASREEMELRIASLEQQLKQCQAQLQGQAGSKNRQPPAAMAETPQSKREVGASSSITGDSESIAPERWDADERERLYLLVQSKDEIIHRQETSIAELKAQLRASSEHCAQCQEYEMQLRSLRSKHEALQSEHYAIVRQYDEAQEQLDQAAAQADLDKADFHLEVEALRYAHSSVVDSLFVLSFCADRFAVLALCLFAWLQGTGGAAVGAERSASKRGSGEGRRAARTHLHRQMSL